MIAHGRVQNGVVVLNSGVRLPEGQEVIVLCTAQCQAPRRWKARGRTASSTFRPWPWARYFVR